MLNRFRPVVWIPVLGILTLATWYSAAGIQAQTAQARKKNPARTAVTRTEATAPATSPGEVDVERSRVYVYVDKTGLGHEHGIEGLIRSGQMQIGAKSDAGSIEFDLTSFQADTDRARRYVGLTGSTSASTRQQVQKNLLGADVLDAKRYPTATFKIASAQLKKTPQGQTQVEMKGEFTLHGKTRPIAILANATQQKGDWNLKGDFAILQTEYGIKPYTTALGAVGVADQLRIYGDLWIAGAAAATE
ncbi:MAG: YceI family protein [Planctomycetes bacterium]|nr:YceI family protein [Planctomycetota bacterium]